MTTDSEGNAGVLLALVQTLRTLGVHECCVAAGARNAAIIAVLQQLQPEFHLRHFFEERSAAFFALGRVMDSRRPVAVITTSGTAAAELLPAVIEAHYQGLPLVAVTADRPERYCGSGAPQAIEQEGLFGCYVRHVHQLSGHLLVHSGWAGEMEPVHINVRLEEGPPPPHGLNFGAICGGLPLLPSGHLLPDEARQDWDEFWANDLPTVVLASGLHPEEAAWVTPFLAKLALPIVAEATANLPSDGALQRWMLRGGETALQKGRFARVLRIGGVPSWRWWRDLEDRRDVPLMNLSRTAFRGLARQHNVCTLTWEALEWPVPAPEPLAHQHANWGQCLDEILDKLPLSEPAWMRHLSLAIGPEAKVFLGNSLPIREWNLAGAPLPRGAQVFANRGANGIDGLLSTWLGTSLDAPESWAIIGDLSALYDLSAPWILPQLPPNRRRLVIINNGGGKIFSHVGWMASLPAETLQLIENPHQHRFDAWAAMWGLSYRAITAARQLTEAHSHSSKALEVWEIRPNAEQTEAFWHEWGQAAK